MSLINIELDLNKAFAGSIVKNDKTGDNWVNLTKLQGKHIYQNVNKGNTNLKVVVSKRKEVSQYGHTHSLALAKDKGEQTVYVGDGKEFIFDAQQPTAAATADLTGDLPF